MKKYLPITALVLATLLGLGACGKTEEKAEEQPKETPLTVTPSSAKNERSFGHEIVFIVQATGEVQAEIAGAPWAVPSVGAPEGDKTPVAVALDANDGANMRSCIMVVSCGDKKVSVPITQSTLSSMIGSGSDLSMAGRHGVLTFKLSYDWTVSLSTTRGVPDWLDVEPKGGKAGEKVDLHFDSASYNLAAAPREAYARVDVAGGQYFFLHISQPCCLPSADFLDKESFGIYNYDSAGAELVFDPLAHQSVVLRGQQTGFRLIWPAKEKFLDLKPLPEIVAENDEIETELVQYWLTALKTSAVYKIGVLKVTPERIYAVDDHKVGFIFKNLKPNE